MVEWNLHCRYTSIFSVRQEFLSKLMASHGGKRAACFFESY